MLDQDHETELAFGGQVIRLREWGTDCTYELSSRPGRGWCIGASSTCALRLTDPDVALKHAELFDERGQWHIRDLDGTTGVRQDGELRKEFALTPGTEIGIGATVLIAESERYIALREFCARLLGWGGDRMFAVDHALRAIRIAAAHRSTLVLRGDGDLVPLAHALHRRVLGPTARFVVCDPRRGDLPATARSPANMSSAVMALEVAAGGSLCVRSRRLPQDLPELMRLLDVPDHRVQLLVCMGSHERSRILMLPLPIEAPPISLRETELPRIVQAYAADAFSELCAAPSCFSDEDQEWVMKHSARSLSEIEKATLRVVAFNKTGSVYRAAGLIGIAPVSLSRWLDRRVRFTGRALQVGTP
jgi:hypothetical protein